MTKIERPMKEEQNNGREIRRREKIKKVKNKLRRGKDRGERNRTGKEIRGMRENKGWEEMSDMDEKGRRMDE